MQLLYYCVLFTQSGTPAPAICTCDSQPSLPQAQSVQRAAMAAQSTDSSQEHGADYMQTLHAKFILTSQ